MKNNTKEQLRFIVAKYLPKILYSKFFRLLVASIIGLSVFSVITGLFMKSSEEVREEQIIEAEVSGEAIEMELEYYFGEDYDEEVFGVVKKAVESEWLEGTILGTDFTSKRSFNIEGYESKKTEIVAKVLIYDFPDDIEYYKYFHIKDSKVYKITDNGR